VSRFKPPLPRIDLGNPLSRGLVGAWPFYERAGTTVRDVGPYRNNGTAAASPTWAMQDYGPHLLLNGSTQYVDAGNPTALQITGDISVAVWVRFTSTAANGTLAAKDHSSGGRAWTLDYNTGSGGIVRFYLGGSGTDLVSTSAGVNTTGWHLVIGTWRASDKLLAIYVDGLLRSSLTTTQTSIPTATANVYFGARQFTGSQNFLNGRIGDVKIWNRPITASEAHKLYTDPWGLYQPGRDDEALNTALILSQTPIVVTPTVLDLDDIEILTPTVDNGAGVFVTPTVLELDDIEILTPTFAGSVPVAPFFSDETPEDDATRVDLDAEVSVVATPPDPTGNPIATAGMLAPTATVNGVAHTVTIVSLSGGAKRVSVAPIARAGKVHEVEFTVYEQDGTPHVTTWDFTYRPAYPAVGVPLQISVRGATAVGAPLALSTLTPASFGMPLTLTVPATGVLQGYGMPMQYTVLDVGSGVLAGFPVGLQYRAVDRLRAAALYAGAVVAEWREDRIAFGAAAEGTRRALVALAATLAGTERETALRLAAGVVLHERETVAALGATLAEWGQDGVPMGADAQAVTRRLLYQVRVISLREQAILSDED
jgi:hypothetical protein